ncbi:MAG: CHC2 zinc finger domain-containing protein [Candidatus Marinimicrobia bacterium]|nr:CHC2 zinc finger domain-containing protein [Candidatus Neomarinimicrobiota bacterium]
MKKFSSRELFELRNAIPVEFLIQNVLQVPSKTSEGVFRVLCPICNEFQTGVNPNVNLMRCFRCEKNFNAIDLVMEVQGCGFKESVLFLQHILEKNSNRYATCACPPHPYQDMQCNKTG